MSRLDITTSWTARNSPWENCMSIIQTWFYDDSQVWEDNKIWWDVWIIWISWTEKNIITIDWNERPTITTNWN